MFASWRLAERSAGGEAPNAAAGVTRSADLESLAAWQGTHEVVSWEATQRLKPAAIVSLVLKQTKSQRKASGP